MQPLERSAACRPISEGVPDNRSAVTCSSADLLAAYVAKTPRRRPRASNDNPLPES